MNPEWPEWAKREWARREKVLRMALPLKYDIAADLEFIATCSRLMSPAHGHGQMMLVTIAAKRQALKALVTNFPWLTEELSTKVWPSGATG